MKDGKKMVKVPLPCLEAVNSEDVKDTLEMCENNKEIDGMQVVVDQVSGEEALATLKSLLEQGYSVNVTEMEIGITR